MQFVVNNNLRLFDLLGLCGMCFWTLVVSWSADLLYISSTLVALSSRLEFIPLFPFQICKNCLRYNSVSKWMYCVAFILFSMDIWYFDCAMVRIQSSTRLQPASVGPLKTPQGELVTFGEDMNRIWNSYFFECFYAGKHAASAWKQADMHRGRRRETRCEFNGGFVGKRNTGLRSLNLQGQLRMYPRILNNVRRLLAGSQWTFLGYLFELPAMWRQANVQFSGEEINLCQIIIQQVCLQL